MIRGRGLGEGYNTMKMIIVLIYYLTIVFEFKFNSL